MNIPHPRSMHPVAKRTQKRQDAISPFAMPKGHSPAEDIAWAKARRAERAREASR